MPSFDPISLDLRAKNRSQTPAEFANAITRTRRRTTKATKFFFGITVFVAVGALILWRVQL